jgi:hypothetical protein
VTQHNVKIGARALRAVEQRGTHTPRAPHHPQIECHWPPDLPYSGVWAGADVVEQALTRNVRREAIDMSWISGLRRPSPP